MLAGRQAEGVYRPVCKSLTFEDGSISIFFLCQLYFYTGHFLWAFCSLTPCLSPLPPDLSFAHYCLPLLPLHMSYSSIQHTVLQNYVSLSLSYLSLSPSFLSLLRSVTLCLSSASFLSLSWCPPPPFLIYFALASWTLLMTCFLVLRFMEMLTSIGCGDCDCGSWLQCSGWENICLVHLSGPRGLWGNV